MNNFRNEIEEIIMKHFNKIMALLVCVAIGLCAGNAFAGEHAFDKAGYDKIAKKLSVG